MRDRGFGFMEDVLWEAISKGGGCRVSRFFHGCHAPSSVPDSKQHEPSHDFCVSHRFLEQRVLIKERLSEILDIVIVEELRIGASVPQKRLGTCFQLAKADRIGFAIAIPPSSVLVVRMSHWTYPFRVRVPFQGKHNMPPSVLLLSCPPSKSRF